RQTPAGPGAAPVIRAPARAARPPGAAALAPAHKVARGNDFMDLAPSLRNFDDREAEFQLDPARRRGPAAAPFRFRASTRLKGKTNPSISPSETKRFAGVFVFKGLARFSFRRFHQVFVFNDLAHRFVSPRYPHPPPNLAPQGAPKAGLYFCMTEILIGAFPVCQEFVRGSRSLTPTNLPCVLAGFDPAIHENSVT